MKKNYFLLLSFAALSMAIAGCGSGDEWRAADSDSVYVRGEPNEQEVAADEETAAASDAPTLSKATDERGKVFYFLLNGDGSAKATAPDWKGTAYGNWEDFSSIGMGTRVMLDEYEPVILYKGGYEQGYTKNHLYIKDGWLYAGGDYAKSNNPNWRIKVEKTTEKVDFPDAMAQESPDGKYVFVGYYKGHRVEYGFELSDGNVSGAYWNSAGAKGPLLAAKVVNGEFYGETSTSTNCWVRIDLETGKGKVDWLGEGEREVDFTRRKS